MSKNIPLLGLLSSLALFLVGVQACTKSDGEGSGPQQADASSDGPAQPEAGGDGPDGSDGNFFTGPIAPECTDALEWCAQVEVNAALACKDVDGKDFTITTRFSGKTDGVSCGAEDTGAKDGSTHDLWFKIQPPQADAEAYATHAVEFWLANYTGPGTYPLESVEAGDYRGRGFWLQGATSGSQADAKNASAGSEVCKPSPCQAIVAQGSDTIPHDESVVQGFRVRVEVKCTDGGELWTHPDCAENSRCTLQGAPTLKFEVVCSH
mgnify:CR=1 FL=1